MSGHFATLAVHNTLQQTQNEVVCKFCNQSHYIASCASFKELDVGARKDFVSTNRLCYNCLGSHAVRDCRSKKSCYHCQGRHHSLLHLSNNPTTGPAQKVESNVTTSPLAESIQEFESDETVIAHTSTSTEMDSRGLMFLATAQIMVSANGKQVLMRALIDPCSDASFMKESMVQLLRLRKYPSSIQVGGIGGGISQVAKAQVSVLVSSRFSAEPAWSVSALVLGKLTDYLPPHHCLSTKLDFLEGLEMADPHYSTELPIDMILGVDIYTQIILSGVRKNPSAQLIAQETTLGWIISGKIKDAKRPVAHVANCHSIITNEDILQLLNRFWDQEEIPVSQVSVLSKDEAECEKHFSETVSRDCNGRYILRLPFNEKISQLADSYHTAERMLLRMERRFASDQKFFNLYSEFIEEYIQLGHAEYVDPSDLKGKKVFYLPHHGVLKGGGEEAKIRVVFNGSVRLAGPNLNNCLHAGPKLLLELRDVIQLWRMLAFVWSADIIKMFRQILIDPLDQDYLLILWRNSPRDKIRIIRLKTVTYGLVCAPYQALKTLRTLSRDDGDRFPLAKIVIEDRTYMDDSYGGSNCLEEAKLQQNQVIELFRAGGFELSKWAANNSQLLINIYKDKLAQSPGSLDEAASHDVLGLSWLPSSDTFMYKNHWPSNTSSVITKRRVLAQAAKLYDPLGWISPIIFTFKIFMQSLWTMGIQWDDPLSTQKAEEWTKLTGQLADLSSISIPRHVGNTESISSLELHGFADASEKAMAAVIYLRVRGEKSSSSCTILVSKTKVAPLKQISIPRLELNAAHLLAKLVRNQVEVLSLKNVSKFLWSDSAVALSWIQGHPTRWTTYVANRVSAIQTAVPDATWSHVSGSLNPADLASRGTTVHGLINADYWLAGPEFLRSTAEAWQSDSNFKCLDQCPEERKVVHVTVKDVMDEWELLRRYSSLEKLLRVTARCQEFLCKLKNRKPKSFIVRKLTDINWDEEIEVLSPEQIISAEKFWIRHSQECHFSEEIKILVKEKSLSKGSRLLKLTPFLDKDGLLRLGGRLKNAMIEENSKHPFILSKDSTLSQLLIRDTHLRTLHGGVQLVLCTLRQKYWLINGRAAVKSIISSCVRCWKQKPIPSTQIMGDLPAHRVRPARAFLHSGIDYAGPILLRLSKGRGVKAVKGYIAIFVCFSTRAVHLEVASDYSAEEFIAVYKRFVGRRGICATLYSDCGTNFVGADRQLRQMFEEAGTTDKKLEAELSKFRTAWKFNPAGAPHFGGLWEAGVKMTKHHLKRVMGEYKLTFEELSTLLIQIEACLNSRPLQALSDDPSEVNMLTPAHFLVGEPLNLVAEPSLLNLNDGRLSRWQLVRKMTESFWKNWSTQYLQSLQMRNKWSSPTQDVKVGDICRVKVETMIPCRWPLGRIVKIHPGADDHVRVVTIKTANSTFQRPIAKVCLLPILDNYSSLRDEGGRND